MNICTRCIVYYSVSILALICMLSLFPAKAQEQVNVYSYRQPFLVEPLFAAFTRQTGVDVRVIYAKGLIERMVQEGRNSPADVLLAVDIGSLSNAVIQGLTQPIVSELVDVNIPRSFRHPNNHWVGLTSRARVVYASRDRVAQNSITYEELADFKWKGRICTRSGQHVYTIALIASMISHHGEENAKEWLRGLKANLARKPAGNDRAQIKSIFAGECDISLGNTYYMALMLTNEKELEQKEWGQSVKIIMPNAADRGTHINLSGVILAKNAPHRKNAVKLIEWLTGAEAQKIYADVNHEYPLSDGIDISDMVASFGDLHADEISFDEIARYRKRASEIVDEVGFDEGLSF